MFNFKLLVWTISFKTPPVQKDQKHFGETFQFEYFTWHKSTNVAISLRNTSFPINDLGPIKDVYNGYSKNVTSKMKLNMTDKVTIKAE